MLTKRNDNNRNQIVMSSIEDLVPEEHLLRKIDNAINFDFIYEMVEDLYSNETGRPSIDPVVLIKIILIQYIYGIASMRQTIRDIEVNLAYRWFIGYSPTEKIPHFSTFGKNYERRFKNTTIFHDIFIKILEEAEKNGFIHPEQVYIDSTHIKASANKNKYEKVEIEEKAKHYQKQLEEEINKDREEHNKKRLKKKDQSGKIKKSVRSKTDKDAGMFHKNEKEKCFAYSAHTACDDSNFILGFEVTAGNIHDSVVFNDVYEKVKFRYENKIKAIGVDAGYVTPYICKTLLEDNVLPVMPYKRPMTKKGFFRKYEYVYDEYYDCYICPNNEILKYVTTNREGYREYKSDTQICKNCPYLNKCTESKTHQKVITRHVWSKYSEEANHLRYTPICKGIYKRRKETIERVFADAKEKHGMRYTRLRGLAKVTMEVTLTFACMNLKKLANWKWNKNGGGRSFLYIPYKTYFFNKNRRDKVKNTYYAAA
jgi:transposase